MLFMKIWLDEVYSIDHTWCDKALALMIVSECLLLSCMNVEMNTFFFYDHFISTVSEHPVVPLNTRQF